MGIRGRMMTVKITTGTMYRADHVGSLLRPAEVLRAHADYKEQRISHDELRAIEDRAILAALDLQKEAGVDVYSDGEYRRGNWAGDFAAAVDGYVYGELPIRFEWRMPEGISKEEEEAAREAIRHMPYQSGMII